MKRFSFVSTLVGVFVVSVTISAQAPQGGGRGGGGRGGRGGAEPQGGAAPQAQGRGGPQLPTPKNLQFFPKDMTGQQIVPIMAKKKLLGSPGSSCGFYLHLDAEITEPLKEPVG